jgi:hypothetical protein
MTGTATCTGRLLPGRECQMDKVARECGNGWSKLIDPLEAEVERLGGTVQQIKEKFAGLRFYYYEGDYYPGSDKSWEALDQKVEDATRESYKTCEMCGSPGILMTTGSWLKTLCADDALSLGFRKKAQT